MYPGYRGFRLAEKILNMAVHYYANCISWSTYTATIVQRHVFLLLIRAGAFCPASLSPGVRSPRISEGQSE